MSRRAAFVGFTATTCLLVGAVPASAAWTIQPVPSPARATVAQLNAVSCVTAVDCIAVGSYRSTSGAQKALAERLAGGAWRVLSTPSPSGESSVQLSGISCPTRSLCVAVGSYVNVAGLKQTLIERLARGHWTIQAGASLPATVGSELLAVSCSAANACTAVGGGPIGGQTLAERWNGSRWEIEPTPTLPNDFYPVAGELAGVSCTSATFCVAVGTAQFTLAEAWNGRAWTIQPTPAPTSVSGYSAVACKSASACEAVGFAFAGRASLSIAAGWDGTIWTDQPSADPSATNPNVFNSSLSGVSCAGFTSASDACYAVGSAEVGNPFESFAQNTLGEMFDGTTWTVQPTPNPDGSSMSALSGISCNSTRAGTKCTAVGSASGGPLVEHF
jgi:hypothetical protein